MPGVLQFSPIALPGLATIRAAWEATAWSLTVSDAASKFAARKRQAKKRVAGVDDCPALVVLRRVGIDIGEALSMVWVIAR